MVIKLNDKNHIFNDDGDLNTFIVVVIIIEEKKAHDDDDAMLLVVDWLICCFKECR